MTTSISGSKVNEFDHGFLGYFDNLCQREKPLIWVATTSGDGRPHVVPTCFVKPLDGETIAIGCTFVKKTVNNIKQNGQVAMAAAKFDGGYDGYMVKGKAKVVEQGAVFDRMSATVKEATGGRRTVRHVILVSVDEVYSLSPREGRKRVK